MAATLEGVSGFDELRHLFVEFADPVLLFGTHFVLVVLDKGDIFGVLYLAPFSIIFSRNILLLFFGSPVLLFTGLTETNRLKFLTALHI